MTTTDAERDADTVLMAVTDGIATLTLNRPDKLNALHIRMLARLHGLVDEIAARDDVRVVVVSGAGRSFCAGHDLEALAEADAAEARYIEGGAVDALEALPIPVVGKIRGHCLTGGLELALACDLLIAADDASLGDTHGRWGLVPVWGMSVRLPERVGYARAKELSFTSRRIDGAEAARIGLVDHAVPAGELDDRTAALVAEIAANSAGSNARFKRLYADARRLPRHDALAAERDLPYGFPPDMMERMTGGAG
ncbi:enoyl-CoA hydratase/isomerase family protein [Tsukamurella sp. 1534]|uniref:enoyl-CoA hydratase/isomerase family protein n=1 Tax=Tsukamurella sp. 1534 TaxID=1151061 RepID=UPI0002E08C6E|nr:enoyl-CoA hydratase/isomerase family protein [Tsukamurella sp. 1534]